MVRLVGVGLNPSKRAFQPLATPAAVPIAVGEKPTPGGGGYVSKTDNISKADNQPISLDDSISWCNVQPI